MIKIKRNLFTGEKVPHVLFRQAEIKMSLSNGRTLGTVQTLDFQEDAPTKEQWLAKVRKSWDVSAIAFRDLGIQSCIAPRGHDAWKTVNS